MLTPEYRFETCQATGPERQEFSDSQNDPCNYQVNRQLFVLLTAEFLWPDGPA